MTQKTLVQTAWLGFWLVFIALLFYLGTYNPALEIGIQKNETLNTASILVTNPTAHAINQIKVLVTQNNSTATYEIEQLNAFETQEIQVPFNDNIFDVTVTARFHRTASERTVLETPTPVKIQFIRPANPRVGTPFEIQLEICNQSSETEFETSETHDPSFLGLANQTQTLSIEPQTCQTTPFSFQSAFSGITRIVFNIQTASYNQTAPLELVIGS